MTLNRGVFQPPIRTVSTEYAQYFNNIYLITVPSLFISNVMIIDNTMHIHIQT